MRFPFTRRRPVVSPADMAPSAAEILTDLLGVMEDIRDDMRGVRDALEPADLRADLRTMCDRVELATDHLADARARDAERIGAAGQPMFLPTASA